MLRCRSGTAPRSLASCRMMASSNRSRARRCDACSPATACGPGASGQRSPKVPRDQQYRQQVADILALYTGPLAADERVLCVDEKTSLQPRPRTAPTHPAAPGRPVRMEHEYGRRGALNLFAAFDTRCGQVLARTASRKRASEFVGFLEYLDASLDPSLTIHLVLDNLRVHKGKLATAWFREHPRFVPHFPPVHCSWLNQVEQWFGILQRKLLARPNHPSAAALADTIEGFVERWNKAAHPFNWTSRSLCRVMAAPIPTPV
ncbi:MAG: IS630 family transposase [Dehalococcoidia bacterium]